jgi:hypothetical protein
MRLTAQIGKRCREKGYSGIGLGDGKSEQHRQTVVKPKEWAGSLCATRPVVIDQPVYLPEQQAQPSLQQSGVQAPWQQSPHLSVLHDVQQDVQHAELAESCAVWASAETARTTVTERTANIRFMEISLTLKMRGCAARRHQSRRPLLR